MANFTILSLSTEHNFFYNFTATLSQEVLGLLNSYDEALDAAGKLGRAFYENVCKITSEEIKKRGLKEEEVEDALFPVSHWSGGIFSVEYHKGLNEDVLYTHQFIIKEIKELS